MAQKQYYYCTSKPYTVGDTVSPGNWGKIIQTYTPQNSPNAWILARELAYELVRVTHYPEKPSRFHTIYLCNSLEDLLKFQQRTGRANDTCYVVELLDETALSHSGDWSLPSFQMTDDLPTFMRRAHIYWQATMNVESEFITLSPVKVVEVIQREAQAA